MRNGKAHILIVDDDEAVRASYARILSPAHCDTQEARDGEEALKAMERGAFDLVLLDLRMPGMDGLRVLETVKRKWPESEVVIITGFPSVASAKEAVRLGAFDYLAKPVGPEEVIGAARNALTHKQWTLKEARRQP